MKEVWIPRRQHEGNPPANRLILKKANDMLKTARQKSVMTFAGLVAVASVGLAGCGNVESQSPIGFKTPTSTPYPTPTPEPTHIPTLVPTSTPEPTPTRIPTATPKPTETPRPTPAPTKTPEPTPTRTPVPTRAAEPTPTSTPTPTLEPAPTKTPVPTKTPKPPPTPTLTPTPRPTPTPAPTPTPTEVPKINLEVGKDYKYIKCFNNTSTEPKKRSIDYESTGGDKGNIKAETRLLTDLKKIIPQEEVFNIRPGNLCLLIKMTIRSGAFSQACYGGIFYNFRSREPERDGSLLERGSLIQNFCIRGALQGSFDEEYHEYDPVTNTVTSLIVIDNPVDIPQQTKYQITEPCSFLEFAEQEIRDVNTNLRIFPDQPQTIPAKEKVRHSVRSTLPYGKVPTSFPLKCTVKLERILEE